ncbi:MAG TPA: hypothetical protein VFR66_18540 [Burkholderiales bacterium]|nr:hypothetical protein [Burkholderiales bacterium]
MLFAQAAFALAACNLSSSASRAQMIATQGAETAGCHEAPDNAHLCLAHCQGREQTLDKHQLKLPEAPLHFIQLARAWHDAPQLARFAPRVSTPTVGPPPRILFRTLLI